MTLARRCCPSVLQLLTTAALACALCAPASGASLFIEELTWPEVRDAIAAGKTSAIYYAGSTEQNGPHLVLGKHNFVARAAAQRIAETLGNALIYPVLPFAPTGDAGRKSGHMKFSGTVTLSEATFGAVARDVAQSALAAGFLEVFLMGDHGGGQDTLKRVAAELDQTARSRGARVHYIGDVYHRTAEDMRRYLSERQLPVGEHAGLPDTAEVMAIDQRGAWVRRDRLAAGTPDNGVDGDPRQATAELGQRLLDIKVANAVRQIRRLSASEPK